MNKSEFTKANRQRIAKAFEAAKRRLPHSSFDSEIFSDGRNPYICVNLQICMSAGEISVKACVDAQTIIRARLEGHGTLGGWLEKRHVSFRLLTKDVLNGRVKIQAARHAWLDSLIAEFSK